jgi:hypothetical protein
MARETKTIPLKKPFDGAGRQSDGNRFAGTGRLRLFHLGDPQTWVRAKGGMALVDNVDTIRAYTERMIVKPDPLLAMTANVDARRASPSRMRCAEFFRGRDRRHHKGRLRLSRACRAHRRCRRVRPHGAFGIGLLGRPRDRDAERGVSKWQRSLKPLRSSRAKTQPAARSMPSRKRSAASRAMNALNRDVQKQMNVAAGVERSPAGCSAAPGDR